MFKILGVSGCALLYTFLTEVLKYKNVVYDINERVDGNGINDKNVSYILEMHKTRKIGLVASIDHGSSSGDNIAKIMDAGIETVITDHHTLSPDNAPYNYNAFINPQRPECTFDKAVSGCAVAYFLCLYVADKLNINRNSDDMKYMLSLAGLTTISDSMKMNSITNRALVRGALNVINTGKIKNWVRIISDPLNLADYKTFGFVIAPMINSASRMGDSKAALIPLISRDNREMTEATSNLAILNKERKLLQNSLYEECRDSQLMETASKYTVVQVINKGLGIQGIIASRFTSSEQKPTVIFCRDKSTGMLQGSGRTARKVNLLGVLREIEKAYPNEIPKCGGHEGAAGITIVESFLPTFKKMFDDIVCVELNFDAETENNMEVRHDVDLEVDGIDYELFNSVRLLSPYGQEWPEPIFITAFKLLKFSIYNRSKTVDIYNLTLLSNSGLETNTTFYSNGDVNIELVDDMYIDIIYKVKYSPTFDKNISMDILDMRASTKVINF